MRHLITFAIFLAAVAAYVFGVGPLFFGTPLVGTVLVLAGVLLELAFWLRLFRRTPAAPASTSASK
jgi:hypothetical protein